MHIFLPLFFCICYYITVLKRKHMNSLVLGFPTGAVSTTTIDNQCKFSVVFTTLHAAGLAEHTDGKPTKMLTIADDGTICRGGTDVGSLLDSAGQLITHDGTTTTVLQPGIPSQFLTVGADYNLEWTNIEIPSELPVAPKGVLISADGLQSTQVPVGTNGQVLVADSAAPSGLAWQDVTSGTTGSEILLTGEGKYTVPAGVTGIKIQAMGAGGGGSSTYDFYTPGVASDYQSGGGGGGSGAIVSTDLPVTEGLQLVYSCGMAGQGGLAGGNGSNGTATTITIYGRTLLSANGGQGGQSLSLIHI